MGKRTMAVRLRQAGRSYRQIAASLGVSHETARLWCVNATEVFREEVREKARCRPKQAIGKKRPRQLITPSSFKEAVPP